MHTTKKKNSLTSVNWQVINFMMQNQNTRNEDGEEKKNSVVCNCVCPDPSRKHPPSPLRNPCLCILKSFCCCGCYCCCFRSASQISEEEERFVSGSFFVVWFITDQKSELRPLSFMTLRWTNAVIVLSERFATWTVCQGTVKRIQITVGPEQSVKSCMYSPVFFFNFLVSLGTMTAGRRQGGGITEECVSN